jgi:hypothetical protein
MKIPIIRDKDIRKRAHLKESRVYHYMVSYRWSYAGLKGVGTYYCIRVGALDYFRQRGQLYCEIREKLMLNREIDAPFGEIPEIELTGCKLIRRGKRNER